MLATTRLNLLPMHRLGSGLRKIYSFRRPEKNTFIHYDSQIEEDQPDIVKCVSNLLDGTPARWKEDEVLKDHLNSIVSSYETRSPKSPDQIIDWNLNSPKCLSSEVQVLQEPAPCAVKVGSPGKRSTRWCDETDDSDETPMTPGEWSVGAALHEQGLCKPCGWNRKAGGCSKGADCEFCHVCDDGALKRKKKNRLQRIKESKRAARALPEQGLHHQYPETQRSTAVF